MKIALVAPLVLALAVASYSQKYRPHQRMYFNDVPAIQIVGVAMAETMDNARRTVLDRGKQQDKLTLGFPILVDASATMSAAGASGQASGPVHDAWDTRPGGEYTYAGKVSQLYRVTKEGPLTMFLIDRQGRIRAVAFSADVVGSSFENRYTEMIEYLLLNVGGVEAMPYEVSGIANAELRQAMDPSNAKGLYSWEHAAELQKRESGASGEAQTPVYPMLGQQAPDFQLPSLDGKANTSLLSLSSGKVTVLVLFWAGGSKADPGAQAQADAALQGLRAVDRLYVDWTLKLAEPGPKDYPGAQPFGAAGGVAAAPAVSPVPAAQAAGAPDTSAASKRIVNARQWGKEEQGSKQQQEIDKRFSCAIALGPRYFFGSHDIKYATFSDNGLGRVDLCWGAKFDMQLVSMLGLEASVLPGVLFGNFKQGNDNATRQLYIPISVSAKVQPSLGDGKISPFGSLGLGLVYVDTRKSVPNPGYTGFADVNEPQYYDSTFAGGTAFQFNLGLGAEYLFMSKYIIGLDGRYFFTSFEENNVSVPQDNTVRKYVPILKPFCYNNGCILLYGGMKF